MKYIVCYIPLSMLDEKQFCSGRFGLGIQQKLYKQASSIIFKLKTRNTIKGFRLQLLKPIKCPREIFLSL